MSKKRSSAARVGELRRAIEEKQLTLTEAIRQLPHITDADVERYLNEEAKRSQTTTSAQANAAASSAAPTSPSPQAAEPAPVRRHGSFNPGFAAQGMSLGDATRAELRRRQRQSQAGDST